MEMVNGVDPDQTAVFNLKTSGKMFLYAKISSLCFFAAALVQNDDNLYKNGLNEIFFLRLK